MTLISPFTYVLEWSDGGITYVLVCVDETGRNDGSRAVDDNWILGTTTQMALEADACDLARLHEDLTIFQRATGG
jgi:hypothetical protein